MNTQAASPPTNIAFVPSSDQRAERRPIFEPTPQAIAQTQLTAFAASLGASQGLDLQDQSALYAYSLAHFRDFWRHLLTWSDLEWEGDASQVCNGDQCETATFFPALRINYAENLLRGLGAASDAVAITSIRAGGQRLQLTRSALRTRVEALAAALQAQGLGVGHHVVAILRNDADAAVVALAVTAVGASLATVAPEVGAEAIIDRFAPLEPRLLIAHTGALAHDTGASVAARVTKVARALNSLQLVLTLDDAPLHADEGPERAPDSAYGAASAPCLTLSSLLADHQQDAFCWQRFDFNSPLFIMASSGTTGRPKCIVHGAGGTLLEHIKEHRLHCDLRPSDRLFFQTSSSWMMWHWQLSALASGCEIVLYDGPIGHPDTLWRIVQDERVTVFGTSPPYLKLSQDAGVAPGRDLDLAALRAILSTGSILYEPAYEWVRDHVKAVPLQSISGGTDIIGCFVLGNPNLPVYAGESQCRSLAMAVQAASLPDRLNGESAIGELTCANPFPSRPLGLHGDADGSRFHASYFARNTGVWTHGDLIEFTPDGTARMHGRTDGVMNIRGIRVGPAEIYRVVREFYQVTDAMVVEQRLPEVFSEGRAVLLLVLREGCALDATLAIALRRRLAEATSPAHVPEVILQTNELPYTHSGKASEAAMTDAVNGLPVRNLEALRNPACLDKIREARVLQAAAPMPTDTPPPAAASWRSRVEMEHTLQTIWERMLGCSPIQPDDDFFELGGNSLMVARMLAEVHRITGRELALTAVLQAPTISQLSRMIDDAAWAAPAPLVQLRPGTGRPFFMVHSMSGTFLELWAVLRVMDTRRPVYGLQARGLESGQHPHVRVSDMAADYIRLMRGVQANGPYDIGGYSFGGLVAFDIAQQLHRAGETVELLSLIDTQVHGRYLPLRQWIHHRAMRVMGTVHTFRSLSNPDRLSYLQKKSVVLIDRIRVGFGLKPKRPDLVGDLVREANFPPELRRVRGAMLLAMRDYRPEPYPGKAVFLRASDSGGNDSLPFWRKVVRGGLDVSIMPGNHDEMISGANAKTLASALARHL
jgi:acetoacetyl-CoA synthetase